MGQDSEGKEDVRTFGGIRRESHELKRRRLIEVDGRKVRVISPDLLKKLES
jgi:hypothetical protein